MYIFIAVLTYISKALYLKHETKFILYQNADAYAANHPSKITKDADFGNK